MAHRSIKSSSKPNLESMDHWLELFIGLQAVPGRR